MEMKNLKAALFNQLCAFKYRRAKKRYEAASANRYFLPATEFQKFVDIYGQLEAKPFQDYSPEGVAIRAAERASYLSTLADIQDARALEIGASDGMVLKELLGRGAQDAVAVDIVDMLSIDAKNAGVQLVLASAENIENVASESFDIIYSWGSFEHIPDIKAAFAECLRLLKPGGVLMMEAGPLYYSPWGAHYYANLKVPYIHLLFPAAVLHDYARRKRGDDYRNYFPWTNGRPASEYLALVRNLPSNVMIADLWHGYDWFSAETISLYPEIFKAKRVDFEDFFIDSIRIILRKKSL